MKTKLIDLIRIILLLVIINALAFICAFPLLVCEYGINSPVPHWFEMWVDYTILPSMVLFFIFVAALIIYIVWNA